MLAAADATTISGVVLAGAALVTALATWRSKRGEERGSDSASQRQDVEQVIDAFKDLLEATHATYARISTNLSGRVDDLEAEVNAVKVKLDECEQERRQLIARIGAA